MDIRRLLTTLLIAGALMFGFQMMFGKRDAAAGPTVFSFYDHLPEYKVPADHAREGKDTVPEQRTLGDITGAASKDKLSFLLTNVTAGIDQVLLREYKAVVGRPDNLVLFRSLPGRPKPFATLGIHITLAGATKELPYGAVPAGATDAESIARANATCFLDTQYIWQYGETVQTTVSKKISMFLTLQVEGAPAFKITKTFEIFPDSYDIVIRHTVENYLSQEATVAIDQLGAPELPRDDPSMDDRAFISIPLDSTSVTVKHKGMVTIPHQELAHSLNGWKDDKGRMQDVGTRGLGTMNNKATDPILWVSADNRFFTTIIRPAQESTSKDKFTLAYPAGAELLKQSHVEYASVDLIEVHRDKPKEDVAILRLRGAKVAVPPKSGANAGSVDLPLNVYAGPKKKEQLEGAILPAAPGTPVYDHAAYSYISVIQFNLCALYNFCVFDWLVYGILWLLDFLYRTVAFHNYGVAIMILVIVVRAALHPLTRASQINMAKMGKMMRDVQPKVDAIKKKYSGPKDREKQSQEMIKLYRENNINPAGGIMGCLPMLLQLPIWAALMSGLRLDIDLRHAPFIPGWINDLSNPDTIFPAVTQLGHPLFTIPLINFEVYGFNPLPILLAVVLFFNMKIMMASQPKPADEQQAQMQKWSMYSIFMLPIFLYNASSGSNLYFFASTVGGIVDTYFIRKSLKKRGILPPSAKDLPVEAPAK